ncbi:unnamed protein product [Rhizophagus irregularis]|nr:unnamed protein product [Rhizophagus irregularis]
MEYTHLYISQNFDYNFITGAELCFSKIEFLKFNSRGNDKFLSILTKVCKSIKVLKLNIYGPDYNDGIVKLGFYCYYRENLFCQTEIQKYIEWDNLFNILAISSPLGLFEFNFKGTNEKPELESLKPFFDNWEGRHPIILKFQMEGNYRKVINDELIDLVKRYKEKGVIKDYVYYSNFFHRGYTNILDKYIVEVAKKKKRLEQY